MSGWDSYWQDSGETVALVGPNGPHPALSEFWNGVFAALGDEPDCIDLAAGAGAVLRFAGDYYDELPKFTGQDLSAEAVEQLQARFPNVQGVVSDATEIPLPDGSFDLVSSQFGVEYAGIGAFTEAARLLKPGGTLAMIVHCRPGQIYNECQTSLDVVDKLRSARFFPLAKLFLSAGFKAAAGGDMRSYEKAHKQFKPAFRTLERALAKHGPKVASGLAQKLASDIANINRSLQSYKAGEVLPWLTQLGGELDAYRGRMQSMSSAALNQREFDHQLKQYLDFGLNDLGSHALVAEDSDTALAWTFFLKKPPQA